MSQTFTPQWNPYTALRITEPESRNIFCAGVAAKSGSRCGWNLVNLDRNAPSRIHYLHHEMSMRSPREAIKLLPQLARVSLCSRNHQSQADSKVEEWTSIIDNLPTSATSPPPNFSKPTLQNSLSSSSSLSLSSTQSYSSYNSTPIERTSQPPPQFLERVESRTPYSSTSRSEYERPSRLFKSRSSLGGASKSQFELEQAQKRLNQLYDERERVEREISSIQHQFPKLVPAKAEQPATPQKGGKSLEFLLSYRSKS